MDVDLNALSVYTADTFSNFQKAGSHKHKAKKVYIQLKSSSKVYLIRKDTNNNKYVIINGDKKLLKSLKGTYKYVK